MPKNWPWDLKLPKIGAQKCGCFMYCRKYYGKQISKSPKKFDQPHPLPSCPTQKLVLGPKMGVHRVWLCHIPLERPWKGDFKKIKKFRRPIETFSDQL